MGENLKKKRWNKKRKKSKKNFFLVALTHTPRIKKKKKFLKYLIVLVEIKL